jgi:hypothetical protein
MVFCLWRRKKHEYLLFIKLGFLSVERKQQSVTSQSCQLKLSTSYIDTHLLPVILEDHSPRSIVALLQDPHSSGLSAFRYPRPATTTTTTRSSPSSRSTTTAAAAAAGSYQGSGPSFDKEEEYSNTASTSCAERTQSVVVSNHKSREPKVKAEEEQHNNNNNNNNKSRPCKAAAATTAEGVIITKIATPLESLALC